MDFAYFSLEFTQVPRLNKQMIEIWQYAPRKNSCAALIEDL